MAEDKLDDRRFTNRIAHSLFETSYKMKSWDSLSEPEKQFWLNEVANFIEATNLAGIALYDMDDHR